MSEDQNSQSKNSAAIRNGVVAAVLMVLGALGGAGGFKVYTGAKTPSDVFERQDTIFDRLGQIEELLKPNVIRPDPWTGTDAALESARLRTELDLLHTTLRRVDISLEQLVEFVVMHEMEHTRESLRNRERPPTPRLPGGGQP